MRRYDFAIVGAGVCGAWIAYELSKRDVGVVVLEKESDVCEGTSKANSAIVHAGYDPMPGSLMARLNVRGNEIIRDVHGSMAIPFRQVGSLVVAFDDEGLGVVQRLYSRGVENGVPGLAVLSKEETLAMEPNLSNECRGALYAPTGGICSPFELTAAPMDIAIENGVVLERSFELSKVERSTNSAGYDVLILNDCIETKCVINAAGVHSAQVAALFGDSSFSIKPRKGEYSLLDSNVGGLVSHVIFQPPTSLGKGVLVTPTVDGNILVGPTAQDVGFLDDTMTTPAGQARVFESARTSVPSVSERDVITSFAGVRAVSDFRNAGGDEDFVVGFSKVEGLFNVAGICSPGLTSAPAIGEYVVQQLEGRGLVGAFKPRFKTGRSVVRFMELDDDGRRRALERNPLYGRVICRCEGVTEGEIVDSIHRPCGAVDMDGVKRRVRAGMGRCQGGFCGPRVMEILSRELGVHYAQVTKMGRGSWMVMDRSSADMTCADMSGSCNADSNDVDSSYADSKWEGGSNV